MNDPTDLSEVISVLKNSPTIKQTDFVSDDKIAIHDALAVYPKSYLALMQEIGGFEIHNFYFISNVFAKPSMKDYVAMAMPTFEFAKKSSPYFREYSVWPDKDGLIPVGGDYEGGLLCINPTSTQLQIVEADCTFKHIEMHCVTLPDWCLMKAIRPLN